ncbi:MAG: hypothetical protein B7Z66_06680 [Chromatiales bacterium 21-64-14]|nr:MAG: hypothetical protein B7Z66_06680 [Chromatiales bacterium 21-64-14]HQU16534.1 DUF4845 domain-containing protein [Gammaproteobacteria bacterium]
MKTIRRQEGMSMIGLLLLIFIGGFFVLLALRLIPAYLEYFSVASSLDSMKTQGGLADKSPSDLRDLLDRRFEVNNVEHITAREVTIRPVNGGKQLEAKYQVEVPILGNVDAVVKFDKQVTLR